MVPIPLSPGFLSFSCGHSPGNRIPESSRQGEPSISLRLKNLGTALLLPRKLPQLRYPGFSHEVMRLGTRRPVLRALPAPVSGDFRIFHQTGAGLRAAAARIQPHVLMRQGPASGGSKTNLANKYASRARCFEGGLRRRLPAPKIAPGCGDDYRDISLKKTSGLPRAGHPWHRGCNEDFRGGLLLADKGFK
jgi:hypothetical protein